MLLNDDLLSHLPLLVFLYYLGKHEPRNLVSSVMLYTENNTDFACYIFHMRQSALGLVYLRSLGGSTIMFRYYLLGGNTVAPSGLYARLCHAFLVYLKK